MLATLRHRDFALLWVAGLLSVAGDFALGVALTVHAYRVTGSTLAAGATLIAAYLPGVLLGSVAGVFVDRWDRKRTMVAADLLRAAALLPLLAAGSADRLWLLYPVTAAVGAIGLFFGPAEGALLPRLVGPDRLVAANALNALNNNLGRLVGPALGGVLYAWGGLGGVVLADAATFLGSAALVGLIAADARPAGGGTGTGAASAWAGAVGEWRDGLRRVERSRVLRGAFAASALAALAEGVTMGAGFAPFVLDVLGGGEADVGLLLSAQAVGGLLAGVLVARTGAVVPPARLLVLGMVGLGAADLAMFNAPALVPRGGPALAVAIGFIVVAGVPAVAFGAGLQTVVQAGTADAHRGRVLGAMGTLSSLLLLAGLTIGGALGDAVGIRPVLSAGAITWIAGGMIARVLLRGGESP